MNLQLFKIQCGSRNLRPGLVVGNTRCLCNSYFTDKLIYTRMIMAKVYKKKGNAIEVTENNIYEIDIDLLKDEKQRIKNTIDSLQLRIDEINIMINAGS